MPNAIRGIPEIRNLDARGALMRIPQEIDVPITTRVQQLVDTPEFRRLSRISQLGLVSLVYPAAHHTRFEHSLGVYRIALLYLQRLSYDDRFCERVDAHAAEVCIAAALLHDLGHWPFCHPLEDVKLPGVPEHRSAIGCRWTCTWVGRNTRCCTCSMPGSGTRCYTSWVTCPPPSLSAS